MTGAVARQDRHVARLIVIAPDETILLVRYDGVRLVDMPGLGPVSIWVPPGGSLHDDEAFEEAAVRELAEETGIAIGEPGPWVWTRRLRLRFEGRIVRQVERYYVVRLPERPRRVANRSPEAIAAIRWWSIDALRATTERLMPEGLPALLAPILAGQIPPEPIERDEA